MVEYFGDDEEKTPTNKKGGDLSPDIKDPLVFIGRWIPSIGSAHNRLPLGLTEEQIKQISESKEWAEYWSKTAFDLEAISEAGKAFEKDSHDS